MLGLVMLTGSSVTPGAPTGVLGVLAGFRRQQGIRNAAVIVVITVTDVQAKVRQVVQ